MARAVERYGDRRKHGWFAVYKSATKRIREHFADETNLKGSTALAVYGALLEIANDVRDDTVEVERRELAAKSCVGLKAVSEYVAELERAGVIEVERRKVEGVNLPNIVRIVDVEETPKGQGAEDTTPGAEDTTVGSLGHDGSGPEATQLLEEDSPSESQVKKEDERAKTPSVSYRGRKVQPAIVVGAERLLAVFCGLAGKGPGAWTRDGHASPALKQVIGAVLARDEPIETWERGMRAFAASPPSWAEGPLAVGTIFGERAAEWVLRAADAPPTLAVVPGGQPAARPMSQRDREFAERYAQHHAGGAS